VGDLGRADINICWSLCHCTEGQGVILTSGQTRAPVVLNLMLQLNKISYSDCGKDAFEGWLG